MADYGAPSDLLSICGRLWSDAQPAVFLSLHHPFVRALGNGTLDKKAFQSYVLEDYFFLTAFSKAYTASLQKAAEISQEVAVTVSELLTGVQEELQLHHSYAQEWGVQLDGTQQPKVATLNYTKFLLRLAEGPQSLVEVMAAMAPCARLYGYLGCQLAQLPCNRHIATSAASNGSRGHSDHPYSHWIRTYASPSFLGMVAKKEAIINKYGTHLPYEKLRSLYCTAMHFESNFFGEHPSTPKQPRVALLAVDFDDTCSESDTIGTILDTAINAAAARSSCPKDTLDKLNTVRAQLVKDYASGHEALMAELLSEAVAQDAAYDDEWLGRFVTRLSAFDRTMNEAVGRSNILASATADDLAAAGTKVQLQKGCAAVLQRAVSQGVACHVISVNWSSHLVQAALRSATGTNVGICRDSTSSEQDSGVDIDVHCNSLATDDDGITTGRIEGRVECAEDKGFVFESVLLDIAARSGSQDGLSVFVGDSPSDLAALTAADVGIVIGSRPLLRSVASAAGLVLQPLVAADMTTPVAAGILFEATCWAEIEAFLFGKEIAVAPRGNSYGLKVPRVLAVAGSDSGGGAGIQADLKTCAALGVFGMSAITAITAQNTIGVHHVHTLPPDTVSAQMDAVISDIGADAIKTGMLANTEIVQVVAERIAAISPAVRPHVVVDPVLVATSGDSLGCSGVVAALKHHLLPLATLLTPNLPEASALLEGRHIHDIADMKAAAEDLHSMGPQYVLVKGGHLLSSHLLSTQHAVDVLYDGVSHHILSEPVVRTGNSHGTGCTLASAVAAGLAKGLPMLEAVQQAKQYVTEALRASQTLAIGRGDNKPFNHAYAVTDWCQSNEATRSHGEVASADGTSKLPTEALRLYGVTDVACNEHWGRSTRQAVEAAVAGGAGMIQLRLKNTEGAGFLGQAREVVAACCAAGALAIINDRVDIALASEAHGVHVGQGDMAAADVRKLIGPSRILGVSVKTQDEALAAAAAGADYLGAGALFPTSTKQTDTISTATLRDICAAVDIPVVAIGGITAANAEVAINAGCKGVAVVSALFGERDVVDAAGGLLKEVDAALHRQ